VVLEHVVSPLGDHHSETWQGRLGAHADERESASTMMPSAT
jgi:hypothetical protein